MHHKKNQKVVGTGSCPLVCSSLVAASCGPTVGSWQKDESHMVWENRSCGGFVKPKPSLFYYFLLFSSLEQRWECTSVLKEVCACRMRLGCSCETEAAGAGWRCPCEQPATALPTALGTAQAEVLHTGTAFIMCCRELCSFTACCSSTLHTPPQPVLMALFIYLTPAQMFCRYNIPWCKTFLHGKGCQTWEQAA